MTTFRILSVGGTAAVLLTTAAGCCSISVKKSKDCPTCQQGSTGAYYDSLGTPEPAPVLLPAPVPVPPALLNEEELPPPPPGAAQRPSAIQAMRNSTSDFFHRTGENVRAVFTR
jgi:hypothetical protein